MAVTEKWLPRGQGIGLWVCWALGSALGAAIGVLIWFDSPRSNDYLYPNIGLLYSSVSILPIGLTTGLAQAVVLRRFWQSRVNSVSWLMLTAVAWPLAIVVALIGALLWWDALSLATSLLPLSATPPVSSPPPPSQFDDLYAQVIVLVFLAVPPIVFGGALVGLLQWQVLRPLGIRLRSWLIANIVGGIAPGIAFLYLFDEINRSDKLVALGYAMLGVLPYGAITGFVLKRAADRERVRVEDVS